MRKEKIRQNDFAISELPSSRGGQYFDLLRHKSGSLVRISLLQAVFSSPLFVSIFLFWNMMNNADETMVFSVTFYFALSLLIALPIAFVGLCGVFMCLRKMTYADGMFEVSSFFIGVKEHWKKGLICGLFEGIAGFLSLIGSIYLYHYLVDVGGFVVGLGIVFLFVLFLTITVMNYYILSQAVTYENSFRNVIKNAFIFSLMRFPKNLLFFAIHPGISVLLILLMSYTSYVAIISMILFSSFGHLIWMLTTTEAFDSFINKENYPEYYKKGLYIKKQED